MHFKHLAHSESLFPRLELSAVESIVENTGMIRI